MEPASGTEYAYLTNEMTLRPGLIAFLYKLLRWLRSSFAERLSWDAVTPRLRTLYATL